MYDRSVADYSSMLNAWIVKILESEMELEQVAPAPTIEESFGKLPEKTYVGIQVVDREFASSTATFN